MSHDHDKQDEKAHERANENQPIVQPDGEHEGEAPAGEKGAADIAQGADPDNPK